MLAAHGHSNNLVDSHNDINSPVEYGKRHDRTAFSRNDVVEPVPLDRFLRMQLGRTARWARANEQSTSLSLLVCLSVPVTLSLFSPPRRGCEPLSASRWLDAAGLSADLSHFTCRSRTRTLRSGMGDTPNVINKSAGYNEGILTPSCRRRSRLGVSPSDAMMPQQRCLIMRIWGDRIAVYTCTGRYIRPNRRCGSWL